MPRADSAPEQVSEVTHITITIWQLTLKENHFLKHWRSGDPIFKCYLFWVRERGRENPKQAPHCQHRMWRGPQTHKPQDHDLSWNQEPSTQVYLGVPLLNILLAMLLVKKMSCMLNPHLSSVWICVGSESGMGEELWSRCCHKKARLLPFRIPARWLSLLDMWTLERGIWCPLLPSATSWSKDGAPQFIFNLF